MKISPSTVKAFIRQALVLLGARNRVDLVVKYTAQKSNTTFSTSTNTTFPFSGTNITWPGLLGGRQEN